MCGRLSVHHDPLAQLVSKAFGINFNPSDNADLRPSQTVSTIIDDAGSLAVQQSKWGIRPNWAKKDLINAQAETVSEKPTFKRAFAERRCVVPCSGWYEWSTRDESTGKTKYLFRSANDEPIYMAGIWFEDSESRLVTLTTRPNAQCEKYHHRMPLLLPEAAVADYICAPFESAIPMLAGGFDMELLIERAS